MPIPRSMPRAVALLLLAALPAAAQAAGKSKIAVMEVRNVQGVAEGTAAILTDIVVSDVARSHDVISRGDIAAMVGFERQKQVLGCGDETSCLAEIGGALGVDYMLTGQVGQIGTQYRISLLLVDAKKARVAARAAEFCEKNEDALVKAAQRTVAQLLEAVPGGAPPAVARRDVKPVPLPPPPQPKKEAAPASAAAPAPAAAKPVYNRSKAYVAFGASGAFLLGGMLVGLSAQARYNDLKKLQGTPGFAEAWAKQEQGIRRTALGADLLFLTAAVGAGLGTWWWTTAPRVAVAPAVGPGSAGLVASGSF